MNYYCTHSDKNYLAKGITLCKSIIEHDPTAHIFYLCLDNETYDAVYKFDNFKNHTAEWDITAVPIQFLQQNDTNLVKLKNSGHTSNYGNAYSQFCWALTPYFTHLLLNTCDIPSLLYCDADLYFYQSPQLIFDACKNKSVGIHTHGFSSYNPETNDVGEFNVGCVYFKNDAKGIEVATWWKNCMLNPENEHAAKYGTCGDQKYLDLFIPLFGAENIAVFDRDTNPIIKHGAPWNYGNHNYNELVFNHFSHFNTDFNGNWRSSNNGEWKPEETHQAVREFYEQYNIKVTEANNLIND